MGGVTAPENFKLLTHRLLTRRLRGADGFRSRRDATDQTVCWLRFARTLAGPARDGSRRPGSPGTAPRGASVLLRKEVIQPQVPLRLPCYDFIPITTHTLDTCPLSVGAAALGADGFHDVTGGVYKARERIHGAVADAPLLANPTSRGRVADPDPNWGRLLGVGSASRRRCPLYRPL